MNRPSEALVGPSPRERKVVPFPRTLPELRHAAELNLGQPLSGRYRMYHEGREINKTTMKELKPGDSISVKHVQRERPQPTDPVISTQKAHFIAHPPEPPVQPLYSDDTSILTERSQGKPLDAKSTFKTDFPKHDVSDPSYIDPNWQKSHIYTPSGGLSGRSETSYSRQFPWRDATPRRPLGSDSKSVLTDAVIGKPMLAKSSYAGDYARAPGFRPDPARATCDDSTSILTDWGAHYKFEGQSVYKNSFVPPSEPGRQPSARPERTLPPRRQLEGASEYRRHYWNTERPPVLTMEPLPNEGE